MSGGLVARVWARAHSEAARALRTRTLKLRNTTPIVSFTFDDCPASAVANGARLLEAQGFAGTFYLSRRFADRVEDGMAYYAAVDVKRLLERGHEVGCHTASHIPVPTASHEALIEEARHNQTFVAELVGDVRLSTFAYPFGAIDIASKRTMQGAFAACRATFPGVNRGTADLGALRAEKLYSPRLDVASVGRLVREAAKPGSWLIFYTHDVAETPSRYGCTPELFEAAVAAAASAGAQVLTVKNALGAARFSD